MKRQSYKKHPSRKSSSGGRYSVKANTKQGKKIIPAVTTLVVLLAIIGVFGGGSDDKKADLSTPTTQVAQEQQEKPAPSQKQTVETPPAEEQPAEEIPDKPAPPEEIPAEQPAAEVPAEVLEPAAEVPAEIPVPAAEAPAEETPQAVETPVVSDPVPTPVETPAAPADNSGDIYLGENDYSQGYSEPDVTRAIPDPGANIVYIYDTGKRYHHDPNCCGPDSHPITLEEAESLGYTPCQKKNDW